MNKLTLAVLLISGVLFSGGAKAQQWADPVGDIDHNINGFCRFDHTDIKNIQAVWRRDGLILKMDLAKAHKRIGYQEYYFWLDVDPAAKKGYQPYDPYSVAWPNLYADYRVMLSYDYNTDDESTAPRQRFYIQDCRKSDCSQDAVTKGLNASQALHVEGATVAFLVSPEDVPEIASAKSINMGATTYYQFAQCNGEDDAPQWGRRAVSLVLDTTPPQNFDKLHKK
jgi:hypothetical protein